MVFTSPLFLFLFLPMFLGLYFLVSWRLRNSILLLSSLLFYFSGEGFLVWILLFSSAVDYGCGWLIELSRSRWQTPGLAKAALVASIATNLGFLGVFKYSGFAVESLHQALSVVGMNGLFDSVPSFVLPLGISFFTFQSMSYTIDLYRGRVAHERSFFRFLTFVAMFPQLVAGPIVRYSEIADELKQRVQSWQRFGLGAERFLIGLGKKVLIANTVAIPVDAIYGMPSSEVGAGLAWTAAICYTIQIYFDFSGYSDMAIGMGLMLGFTYPENFRHPYSSRSIQEFWRRWHITLSEWFRDYLYIPLGGSRASAGRTYFNLAVVFVLCGLWHGASWNFLVWGLFHGAFLIAERKGLSSWMNRSAVLAHGYVMFAVVISWVLFRADTLAQASTFLSRMFFLSQPEQIFLPVAAFANPALILALIVGVIGSTPWAAARLGLPPVADGPSTLSASLARAALLALVPLLSAAQLASSAYNPFIYFRF